MGLRWHRKEFDATAIRLFCRVILILVGVGAAPAAFARVPDCVTSALARVRDFARQGVSWRRIERDTVVLDTNSLSDIVRVRAGVAEPHRLRRFSQIAAVLGVTEDELRSPSFSLRGRAFVTEKTLAEFLYVRGISDLPRGLRITQRSPLARDADINGMMSFLQGFNVGGRTGDADRRIFSELMFSERSASATPEFITGDRDFFNGLCRIEPACQTLMPSGQQVRAFGSGLLLRLPDRFGRLMNVRVRMLLPE